MDKIPTERGSFGGAGDLDGGLSVKMVVWVGPLVAGALEVRV